MLLSSSPRGTELRTAREFAEKATVGNTQATSKTAGEAHTFQGPGGWQGSALGTARSKDCLSLRPGTELGGGPFQRLSPPIPPSDPTGQTPCTCLLTEYV